MKRQHAILSTMVLVLLATLLAACGSVLDITAEDEKPAASNAGTQPGPADQPESQIHTITSAVNPREKSEAGDTAGIAVSKGKRLPAPARADSMQLAEEARLGSVAGLSQIHLLSAPVDRERYAEIIDNAVKSVADDPVSTFSIDVDTGAYALVRRFLNQGLLPASDAVRIEELINYFDYAYPQPENRAQPFSITTEISKTPWNARSHLLHIGIKGREVCAEERPATNLVFLIDVSGSMNSPDKLPLLKSAFKLLVKQLDEDDRVTMVVYAGASGVVLEPTRGSEKGKILAALERLTASGSTHGSAGIRLAYSMAEQARIPKGINRVILATDGDFNVGTVNHEQLMDLIEQQRANGISLTTLGFGQGNYNDQLMEQLADKGNGNYAYIDTINEAQKVLVDELSATLETIAKDVKIQIEWNPAVVAEYRLIGYENRLLAREDFNNDKVDAGDIGAGHSVTALYEITLVDGDQRRLEPLRYRHAAEKEIGNASEIAFLRLRYKAPDGEHSKLIERALHTRSIIDNLSRTSDSYRFSAAVAGFGQLLRGGRYTEAFDYDAVAELARGARGEDEFGYRGEFQRLVNLASSLGS
jgi:Ca-activated chloride channel family protein